MRSFFKPEGGVKRKAESQDVVEDEDMVVECPPEALEIRGRGRPKSRRPSPKEKPRLEVIEGDLAALVKAAKRPGPGRPPQELEKLRGVPGGLNSNRILAGEVPRKIELNAFQRSSLAKRCISIKHCFSKEEDWLNACRERFNYRLPVIKRCLERQESDERFVERQGISKSDQSGTSFKRTDIQYMKKSKSAGFRKKGGGRKDKFIWAKEKVTAWIDLERELGHNISRDDVLEEFCEIVLKEAVRLKIELDQQEKAGETPDPLKKRTMDGCVERVGRLLESEAYAKTYIKELQKFSGARLYFPALATTLSAAERLKRIHGTWRIFDLRLWQAAFASVEELRELVHDAVEFCRMRKDLKLCFSDQCPLWVKLTT